MNHSAPAWLRDNANGVGASGVDGFDDDDGAGVRAALRTAAFLAAIKRGAQFVFQANPGRKLRLVQEASCNVNVFF